MNRLLCPVLIAYSCLALGSMVAAQPSPQPVRSPRIEPAALPASPKVALKYSPGESERHLVKTKIQARATAEVGGAPMSFDIGSTSSLDLSVNCPEGAGPMKLAIKCDHVARDLDLSTPSGVVKVTVRDRNVHATLGDHVIADTASGQGAEAAANLGGNIGLVGKGLVTTILATGTTTGKLEGDAALGQLVLQGISPGPFGAVLPASGAVKAGDTWTADLPIATLELAKFKSPITAKATYTVAGGATVDGVACVDIVVAIAAKLQGVPVDVLPPLVSPTLEKADVSIAMKGHSYYDPAAGKVVHASTMGTVEFSGAFSTGAAGSGKVAVTLNVSASSSRIATK